MLNEEELRDAALLVFANKQDQPGAKGAGEISEALKLGELRDRNWSIVACSAIDGKGINEGMDWLVVSSNFQECPRLDMQIPFDFQNGHLKIGLTFSEMKSKRFNRKIHNYCLNWRHVMSLLLLHILSWSPSVYNTYYFRGLFNYRSLYNLNKRVFFSFSLNPISKVILLKLKF